ncbi:serine hydrolase [Kitasatospora herbaricolor]|uniref:serine hydrolase domain-containing protein n=1 Tax=Kitasatospora herbaricolor TaxID=68217 RepID=UPI001749D226|nr:serine hydrolase domain-containing protein [Kitasatospora herbaricolor]MDQ0307575.1 CubicO group peptidase (beta-lactamase class C family) [Kitasatospora herbaricolor]GGV16543.1 serine hydrolase [Kitasatospora herbaricolor]
MTELRDTLARHLGSGPLPGAVGLLAVRDRVEVAAVGSADVEGTTPMARDSIFRIASLTKPLVAAALMMLVDEGRLALADPVDRWLPELASPSVVRTPAGPVDDVVPAVRPITVFDLLTSRAGHGFPADFSLPAVGLLFSELKQGPPQPQLVAPPDEWMAALAGIPLLQQPGEAWLYNTSSDIQGVLVARASGRPLPEFLAERLFEPLGMADTGFEVPAGKLGRFTGYYRTGPDGAAVLVDAPDGQWSSRPAFPSGAGGLVSTADDWLAFARMLLADGVAANASGPAAGAAGGRRLLSEESVRQLTSDHLTERQRAGGELFLEGQGWGFGGSVDVEAIDPWNVPGRYGWIGGTGTAAHLTPSTGAVTILLTQLELAGPTPPALMRDFWRYAAGG